MKQSVIFFIIGIGFGIFCFVKIGQAQINGLIQSQKNQNIINVEATDLRKAIDLASPHSIIVCDRGRRLTLDSTLVISKPLTLKGLNAVLADGVGNTAILEIIADKVRLVDFKLKGNVKTIARHEKESLVKVYGSDFIIENGEVKEASRHGIRVYGGGKKGKITNGVLRNIIGHNITRDVISLEGGGNEQPIDNVLVENIKAYNSPERGVVEVSDGATNVAIRNIYGDSCRYGVNIQEHDFAQREQNIRIVGVNVKNCPIAVSSWGSYDQDNRNITIRDIIAEYYLPNPNREPISLSHIDNLTIDNVTIFGYDESPALLIQNCNEVTLRNVMIDGIRQNTYAACIIEDCNDVLVDGLTCLNKNNKLKYGLLYRIQSNRNFHNFRIENIVVTNVKSGGIGLKNNSDHGTLEYYIIKDNIASVVDSVIGKHHLIKDNLLPK